MWARRARDQLSRPSFCFGRREPKSASSISTLEPPEDKRARAPKPPKRIVFNPGPFELEEPEGIDVFPQRALSVASRIQDDTVKKCVDASDEVEPPSHIPSHICSLTRKEKQKKRKLWHELNILRRMADQPQDEGERHEAQRELTDRLHREIQCRRTRLRGLVAEASFLAKVIECGHATQTGPVEVATTELGKVVSNADSMIDALTQSSLLSDLHAPQEGFWTANLPNNATSRAGAGRQAQGDHLWCELEAVLDRSENLASMVDYLRAVKDLQQMQCDLSYNLEPGRVHPER